MPDGFLSLFDQTETIDVTPPGADGHWWVEIKHFLTSEEDDACTKALFGSRGMQLLQQTGSMSGEVTAQMDNAAHVAKLLEFSIVSWNLTGRDGVPLPLQPTSVKRLSIAQLPDFARDKIAVRILKIRQERKQTPAEKASFRGEVSGGDHDGDGGSEGVGGVLDGGGLLAEARTQEG